MGQEKEEWHGHWDQRVEILEDKEENGTMTDLCYSFSTQKKKNGTIFFLCYSLLSFLIMIVGLAGLHLTRTFVHCSSTLYFTLIRT